tara:strand:+ start:3697 stop:4719 length:1023 start_codon:yes stop_codon:yes gene_type:complete
VLLSTKSNAQQVDLDRNDLTKDYDTAYVQSFYELVTARIYLSRKATSVLFDREDKQENDLNYQPNSTMNLGIGATYKGFTLNLAYGFGILNQDEGKGETSYLDLQSHLYGRNYAIDILGQFYTGMYLENTAEINPNFPLPFYLRPDIQINIVGVSYTHLFNAKQFSYAAAMVQNEYQKKSAGSFLAGAKFIVLSAQSDSSMIPYWERDLLNDSLAGITTLSGILGGPGVGYGHSFVLKKHWFLTFSLEFNFLFGPAYYKRINQADFEEWQFNPSVDLRLAMGYNSPKTFVGLSFVQDDTQLHDRGETTDIVFGVGNLRLNYAKRFQLNEKWTNRLSKLPF